MSAVDTEAMETLLLHVLFPKVGLDIQLPALENVLLLTVCHASRSGIWQYTVSYLFTHCHVFIDDCLLSPLATVSDNGRQKQGFDFSKATAEFIYYLFIIIYQVTDNCSNIFFKL